MTTTDSRRTEGRPLIGVGAVVLDAGCDRVLLVQRGAPPSEGSWSIPGGLLERGETLHRACLRELQEETGIEADIQGEVKVLERIIGPAEAPRYHYLIIDFWCWARADVAPRAGSDVRAARWVATDDVQHLAPRTHGLVDVVQRAVALARGASPSSPLFDVAITTE